MIFSKIKRFFKRSRKGVSPLISTVLLIAFAVALGAVVMNWGSDYVKNTAKSTSTTSDTDVKCSMNAYLDLVEFGGTPCLCYNNETDYERIEFVLINGPNVKTESIYVTVLSNTSQIVQGLLNTSIGIGEAKRLNISYNKDTNGEPKQIRFVPKIKIDGVIEPVTCSKNPLTEEEIPTCNNLMSCPT